MTHVLSLTSAALRLAALAALATQHVAAKTDGGIVSRALQETQPPQEAQPPTGQQETEAGFEYGLDTQFYRPGPKAIGAAFSQIAALKNESRPMDAAKISDMIGQPMAFWVTGQQSVESTRLAVQEVTESAAGLGEIPIFAPYNLPFRDCAGFSAGGATTAVEYEAWIDSVAAGIGSGNAVVILEPNSLGVIPHGTMLDGSGDFCMPAEGNPQTDEEERYALLAYAVAVLKANPGTKVYIDGGHADWHEPDEMASRLLRAGVQTTDGFFANVANYVTTDRQIGHSERVAKCVFWGLEGNNVTECTDADDFYAANVDPLIAEKGDDAVSRFVIDTSRNGNGVWFPEEPYPDAQVWCNPPDRALGLSATTATDSPYADAYFWIKVPGESDGICTRGLTDLDGVDPEWGLVTPVAFFWFREGALELAGATGE